MWKIQPNYQNTPIAQQFSNIEKSWKTQGQRITESPLSDLIKTEINNTTYYIKRYWSAGKNLRKFIGTPRVQGEWQNLKFFQSLEIPIPNIIAYGQEKKWGLFQQGILITEHIPNTIDLNTLAQTNPNQLKQTTWLKKIITQLADYTNRIHNKQFIHNDLKWRNILVTLDNNPQIYFIDCPIGQKRYGPLLKRGKIKDLACLDKMAKKCLSKTQRMQFYKKYKQINHLSTTDKKTIRKILNFFKNRD